MRCSPARTMPPANATSAGRAAELARGERGEALAQRLRRGPRRHAVDVAARRCGRRRRVRHLARIGRRHAHGGQRHAELVRDDLLHLGEQALAHLGAAVVQQHRAVLVDVDERAGLVVMRRGERDAELDRRQRDAALDDRAVAIPRGDRAPPRAVAGARFERVDQLGRDVVLDVMPYGVTLRSCVPYRFALAHVERIAAAASRAMSSMIVSIANMPCGPPKPRNAVSDTVCVLQRYEWIATFGSQ